MEALTTKLPSNASAQLFAHNTLSSFTNFLTEQLNLEARWEVAVSEKPSPLMYQNDTQGEFMISVKKYPLYLLISVVHF